VAIATVLNGSFERDALAAAALGLVLPIDELAATAAIIARPSRAATTPLNLLMCIRFLLMKHLSQHAPFGIGCVLCTVNSRPY